jgi:hypothetical protein
LRNAVAGTRIRIAETHKLRKGDGKHRIGDRKLRSADWGGVKPPSSRPSPPGEGGARGVPIGELGRGSPDAQAGRHESKGGNVDGASISISCCGWGAAHSRAPFGSGFGLRVCSVFNPWPRIHSIADCGLGGSWFGRTGGMGLVRTGSIFLATDEIRTGHRPDRTPESGRRGTPVLRTVTPADGQSCGRSRSHKQFDCNGLRNVLTSPMQLWYRP